MDKVQLDVLDLELTIHCLETAVKNGIIFQMNGEDILMKKGEGYDDKQSPVVIKMLQQRTEEIKYFLSDRERIRKALCEGQEALFEANNSVMVLLDVVDRLEKCMRQVWPEFKECINGKDGCKEGSVVFCTACARSMDAKMKENNNGN